MTLPDGSRDPKWLQTIKGIALPLKYLEEAADRYGDIYTVKFGSFPSQVVIANPQAIQEIFTADPKLFESAPGNKILQPFFGDYSLILRDGDYHQRQRRLLLPPFHGERMRAYGNLIRDITDRVISEWTIDKFFTARLTTQEISLQVILRAVFGLDEGERYQQLRQLMSSLFDMFNFPLSASFIFLPALQKNFGSWSPWSKFLLQKQQIDELLYAQIHEWRQHSNDDRQDILTLMISARDEEGQPMTDAELRDELMTLLFAGHETTATALAWALYWIHYIPEVKEKLLQELDALGDNADPTEISKLPYLNGVCLETLRIYPIALFTFPRIVKSAIEIAGYKFEPGTMLSPCIYLTHHRQDLYPEPKQFKPERFLERQYSPYEYLPFGGGNRRCIGMAFALFEMKLVLATILSRYQLKLAQNKPVKPVRRGVTIAPAGGVQMVLVGERQKVSRDLVGQAR